VDAESQGNESLEPPVAGSPPAAARQRAPARALGILIAVFAGMAAVVMVAGLLVYRHEAADVRVQQSRELEGIRDLEAAEIARWMVDQRSSAKAVGDNLILSSAVRLWTSTGAAPPAPFVVRSLIETTRAEQGYLRILLLDPALRAIHATPRDSHAPGAVTRMLGEKAMDRREVVFSDIYLDARGRPQMEFLASVAGGASASSPPPAVLALEVDPNAFLFPLVNNWPTPSKTGETLLVERRGDEVVFLNTRRQREAAARVLAFPISRTEAPAVKTVRGAVGVVTGVDYSGSDVLAAVGPVRGTPWFIVSKVDLSEVDAPLRRLALVTIVIVLGVILLGGAVILFFWSRWRSRDFQRLYEAEREQRASEQRFKSAFENAPVGVSFTLPDGTVRHANATFAEMLGYTVPELEGMTVAEITPPDDRAETASLIAATLAGDSDHSKMDKRYLRKDGSSVWTTAAVTLLRDAQGRPVNFVAMISDISARRDAERDLEENRRFLQRVLDVSPDLIYIFDLVEVRDVFANRELTELLGYEGRFFVDTGTQLLTDLVHPDDTLRLAAHRQRLRTLPEGDVATFEYRMRRYDGDWVWLRCAEAAFQRNAEGEVVRIIGTARDITEQRAAEEQVRRQRDFSATVQRVAGALIVVLDPKGRIVAFNQACEAATGFTEAEMLGTSLWDRVIPPEQLEGVRATFDRLSAGQFPADYENDWLTKDGGRRTIQWNNSAVLDGEGEVEYVIGTGIDITSRVQADEGRREAERELAEMNVDLERRVLERTLELEVANEELEAFSYSVSHDLRSPLRALDGFSLALLEDYGDILDDTARDYLDRVRAGSQRMGVLIDDMLMLSRVSRHEMKREKADLSELARDVVAGLRQAEPGREVEFTLPETLDANGDPGLLRTLLQNLLDNAWKFTARKPQAHIELGVDGQGSATTYFVRDDGAGFDPAYVDKLFTPFQRLHTAKEFPGTGIGLATVQRIVRRHGGRAWADGVVDGGATVYFTLGKKGEE